MVLICFYKHFVYISYTLKVKMKFKKWRPEKLKMVKKHFFPELSGDLWGVICYHHWYPRAGLAGPENSFFKFQDEFENDAKITPWVFSMHRFGLNPHLELIYQLFKKSYFRYFWAFSGPLGPDILFIYLIFLIQRVVETHWIFAPRGSRILKNIQTHFTKTRQKAMRMFTTHSLFKQCHEF